MVIVLIYGCIDNASYFSQIHGVKFRQLVTVFVCL